MIIDSFLAFNEIKLAEFRIKYLWELTDVVIIGESKLTHSGVEKPLYFKEWLNSRKDLQKKVRVVEIELNKRQGHWEREIASREYLQRYLRETFSDRRAILSDLDEIPTRSQVREFLQVNDNVHFKMTTYYRRANFALRDDNHKNWNHGVMIYDHQTLPQNGGRYSKIPTLMSKEIGGHFSYLGMNKDSVAEKLKSFAHNDINSVITRKIDLISFCDRFAIDHLGRFQSPGMGVFEVKQPSNDSDLLTELMKFDSSWFDIATKTPLFILRLFASATVTHSMKDIMGSKSARFAIANFGENGGWLFRAKTAIIMQILRRIQRSTKSFFGSIAIKFLKKGG